MKTKVSIIIPFHNVEAYLRACLDSIIAQTETDWQALLVDDGSTDSSALIAREYCALDNRFRLIVLSTHSGPSMARNAALDVMQCDYVVFVDGDDTIHRDFLRRHLQIIESTHADIAMTRLVTDESDLKTTDTRLKLFAPKDALRRCLYRKSDINNSLSGKLFRANLFDNVRFEPGMLYEDLLITPHIWLKARKIALAADRLYFYRQRQGSITHTFTPRRMDALRVTSRICDYLAEAEPSLLAAARDRRLSAAFNLLKLLWQNGMSDSPEAEECKKEIRRQRLASFTDSRVRLKSKIAVIFSFAFCK